MCFQMSEDLLDIKKGDIFRKNISELDMQGRQQQPSQPTIVHTLEYPPLQVQRSMTTLKHDVTDGSLKREATA